MISHAPVKRCRACGVYGDCSEQRLCDIRKDANVGVYETPVLTGVCPCGRIQATQQ